MPKRQKARNRKAKPVHVPTAVCVVCRKWIPQGGFCYHNTPTIPPEPPMRLFLVTQEREFYVLAEDKECAGILAGNVPENDCEVETYVTEADPKRIDSGWLQSNPYGDSDECNMTIKEWLDERAAHPVPDPKPPDLGPPLFPESAI